MLKCPDDGSSDELEKVTVTDLTNLKAIWRQPPPQLMPPPTAAEKKKKTDETRKRKAQRKIAGTKNTYKVERLLARQVVNNEDRLVPPWQSLLTSSASSVNATSSHSAITPYPSASDAFASASASATSQRCAIV